DCGTHAKLVQWPRRLATLGTRTRFGEWVGSGGLGMLPRVWGAVVSTNRHRPRPSRIHLACSQAEDSRLSFPASAVEPAIPKREIRVCLMTGSQRSHRTFLDDLLIRAAIQMLVRPLSSHRCTAATGFR